ncbi:MAG: TlyA family RNA methyltransferase [Clostridiales Family XIII bacterium]|jgi:23S rRNA (cytidine1920-2'-O)/16S rRNA (cytidine1409-2'-O)-methyltransferase|nr:TlyA family RNA methyltransferase [Clostridiales Family XIII bacterium]
MTDVIKKKKAEKKRLDILLKERGIFPSREKAAASIMAGVILVDGQIADKPGMSYPEDSEITVKEDICPYVSRGGLKLEKAMHVWGFDLTGRTCMDIGASTGGFTDRMLQSGASKVYCVDVGYGQLDWKLRNDPRVVNMERTNIRYVDVDTIDPIDFISIDVSFISLNLVLPVASKLLKNGGQVVALIKPQFEAGREQVGKKGIVRDEAVRLEVIENVKGYAVHAGLTPHEVITSPITGAKGNVEFLILLSKDRD